MPPRRAGCRSSHGRRNAATADRSANASTPATAARPERPPTPTTTTRISAAPTPTRSWIRLQPSRTSSVRASVVRLRLRVMLTTTTLDDIAIDRPIIAAPAGCRPRARQAAALKAHVASTCRGASRRSRRPSRASRRGLISIPTSKRSRTTPTSARMESCSRLATYPGVKGETTTPTSR